MPKGRKEGRSDEKKKQMKGRVGICESQLDGLNDTPIVNTFIHLL